MNKSELIEEMSKIMKDSTKIQIEEYVNTMFNVMSNALYKHEDIKIKNFGNFEIKERSARVGMNPKTKEKIEIPAYKTVTFKVSKSIKEKL